MRFVNRRRLVALVLIVTLACVGGLFAAQWRYGAWSKSAFDQNSLGLRATQIQDEVADWWKSLFQTRVAHPAEQTEIVVTTPKVMDVTITQRFVCQIHSKQHIDVCALDSGYLEDISIKEGQKVKKGEVLFKILPVLYSTKSAAETAEARVAQLEYDFAQQLASKAVISPNEVRLAEAKRDRAKAKAEMVKAELGFTSIVAPFDGIVDRQQKQIGSFIHEGEVLTTLSDNSVMWVYFNVPEKRYFEYLASEKRGQEKQDIELELANHEKFPEPCSNVTIEAQFNNQTGNIAFRADFANPEGVLRHGQTGTILIHRTFQDALVIPQRAVFDLLDKRYIWVLDEDDVAHQRLITVKHELEDRFVIGSGLTASDKIVLEGIREVEEDEKVEYVFRKPDDVLEHQKFHAE